MHMPFLRLHQGSLTSACTSPSLTNIELHRHDLKVCRQPVSGQKQLRSVHRAGSSLRSRHFFARSAATGQASPAEVKPLTFREAQSVAAARGLTLGVLELGPFYRVTCRDGLDKGPIVAVSSGFTLQFLRLMHCDTLQVFVDKLSDKEGRTARERGVGLGLLICGAVLAYGADLGCIKAEILAINDDDFTHRRLVQYYKRMGFKTILEVGDNGLSDLPHLLVWGGAGTRMDISPQKFLATWSNAIRSRR